MPEEPEVVARQIREDVETRLGRYFEPDPDDPDDGYQTIATFGEDGTVSGTSGSSTFTFVRWRWRGRHNVDVPSRIADTTTTMVRATGNPVVVEGLTAVEERSGGDFLARWFVDWLSVYAQLGVIVVGRPVGMDRTEVVDFP